MLLRVIYNDEANQYGLEAPIRSAQNQEAIDLTNAEWADYQRVLAEFDRWQDRIDKSEKVIIPPDPEAAAIAARREQEMLDRWEATRAGNARLQAAKDAGIIALQSGVPVEQVEAAAAQMAQALIPPKLHDCKVKRIISTGRLVIR